MTSGFDAPLLRAWLAAIDLPGAPFTIPGHKRRAGEIWPELGRLLAGDVPLFGGLDSVKDAAASLAAAETLGAQAWGVDWCRYSTGGSTHANQAIALAVGRPGDIVLVSRAAHRSTLLGLILAGLAPVWLPNDVDPVSGLATGVSASALLAALDENPSAVAVLLVEPSYVGTLSDRRALIELAHDRGAAVVVDQAWGAHLGFHPDLPPHALAIGADAMITSAHKTLPAYSQASILLAHTGILDQDRLERGFDASATTSPSGTILASVDAARAVLNGPVGRELLGRLIELVASARAALRDVPGVRTPGPRDCAPGRFDPTKLVIQLAGAPSGLDVERALIAAGMPLEQADRDTLIPIVTMVDDEASVGALCAALTAALAEQPSITRPAVAPSQRSVPPMAVTPRAAFFATHETVPAAQAVGRVSAELIAPYPPGVAVLVPGEVITAETIDALATAADSGVRIAYAADPTLRSFQVVAAT